MATHSYLPALRPIFGPHAATWDEVPADGLLCQVDRFSELPGAKLTPSQVIDLLVKGRPEGVAFDDWVRDLASRSDLDDVGIRSIAVALREDAEEAAAEKLLESGKDQDPAAVRKATQKLSAKYAETHARMPF